MNENEILHLDFCDRLKHKDVFDLIHKHSLFHSISDKIEMLVDFDKDRAVRLLLENMDKVPVCLAIYYLFRVLHGLSITL